MGSDAFTEEPPPFGKYNVGEIKRMVDAGMSPVEAIVSATKISAEALGISDKVGTLEEGKTASLLIVNGNPLNDITILLDKNSIEKLIKEGVVVVKRT